MTNKEINQYWTQFKTLSKKMVRDPNLQDDVLQTSLLKALSSKSKPENSEKILPWFSRILKNTLTDIYRAQKKERDGVNKLNQEPDLTGKETEICNCVLSLLESLPKTDGALLKKLDIDNCITKDVAKELGINPSTLKVRRHRARQKLKSALLECCNVTSKKDLNNCEC